MSKPEERSVLKWTWIAGACVLFGPFAVIYGLGFLGQPLPDGPFFTTWFMGALTVCGVVTTIDFAKNIRRHGWQELGCVLPLAAFACFIGYQFLKMIGLFE